MRDADWKENRERLLITPRRLGRIAKEIRTSGKWIGGSHRHKMRITLNDQINLEGERMTWELRPPGGPWIKGEAGTVFDCIRAMESAAGKVAAKK